jgi:hypothetical protein
MYRQVNDTARTIRAFGTVVSDDNKRMIDEFVRKLAGLAKQHLWPTETDKMLVFALSIHSPPSSCRHLIENHVLHNSEHRFATGSKNKIEQ